MLGFTFSLAASRFDDRRRIVIDEANAIGTTYLRAGMLPEQQASVVQPLLREFVDVRLSMVDPTAIEAGLARSADLQQRLWAEATAAFNEDPHSLVAGLFTQALNDVIDLHAKRNMFALHSRLPELVWLVLYLIALAAMMSLGYQQGLAGSRRSLAVGACAHLLGRDLADRRPGSPPTGLVAGQPAEHARFAAFDRGAASAPRN